MIDEKSDVIEQLNTLVRAFSGTDVAVIASNAINEIITLRNVLYD